MDNLILALFAVGAGTGGILLAQGKRAVAIAITTVIGIVAVITPIREAWPVALALIVFVPFVVLPFLIAYVLGVLLRRRKENEEVDD
ncbi:hypothetical protein [Marimonas arenosa]|uniref:Uncharacterized protein n=1 Tax=Marimonas arenosa TaxID=1795305 RepID=A0AAE3WE39_9RHOB|nr:hypothetical protein [Marimonas arenosa]MDQ2091576.1 hypothetical protein [Marimonas arenosa]